MHLDLTKVVIHQIIELTEADKTHIAIECPDDYDLADIIHIARSFGISMKPSRDVRHIDHDIDWMTIVEIIVDAGYVLTIDNASWRFTPINSKTKELTLRRRHNRCKT